MEYKKLLELGFVREEYYDIFHEERYGYTAFHLVFKNGNVSMFWSPLKIDEVILYLNDVTYNILSDIDGVKEVLNCFK